MQAPRSFIFVSGDAELDHLSCPICFEPNRPAVSVLLLKDDNLRPEEQLTCGHHYCSKCASDILKRGTCSFCRREVSGIRIDEFAKAAYSERRTNFLLRETFADVEQQLVEVKEEKTRLYSIIETLQQEAATRAAVAPIAAPSVSLPSPKKELPAPLPEVPDFRLPIRNKAEPEIPEIEQVKEKARQRTSLSKPPSKSSKSPFKPSQPMPEPIAPSYAPAVHINSTQVEAQPFNLWSFLDFLLTVLGATVCALAAMYIAGYIG